MHANIHTLRETVAAEGVQLAEPGLLPLTTSVVENLGCHPSLDESRADGIDADVGPFQLIASSLGDTIHTVKRATLGWL